MKLSEFWKLMEWEFGSTYARVLARDVVLPEVGNVTAQEALDCGEDVRMVWLAICTMQDVPEERRLGPDIAPKSLN